MRYALPLTLSLCALTAGLSAASLPAHSAHDHDADRTRILVRERRALSSHNWQHRIHAVRVLGRIGALKELVHALGDRHRLVRRAACEALGPIHTRDRERATPALAQRVADKDREVREAAAMALGWMRIKSSVAIHALLHGLDDPYARVRTQSAIALGELRGSTKDRVVTKALIERLGDTSVFVRDAARDSISWLLRDAPQNADLVYAATRSRTPRVRVAAVQSLDASVGWWSLEDARAHKELHRARAALRFSARCDTYWRVREAAKLALASLRAH